MNKIKNITIHIKSNVTDKKSQITKLYDLQTQKITFSPGNNNIFYLTMLHKLVFKYEALRTRLDYPTFLLKNEFEESKHCMSCRLLAVQ